MPRRRSRAWRRIEIAPIGVAAVGDDVAGVEDGAQFIERLVHDGAGRNVEQDEARKR